MKRIIIFTSFVFVASAVFLGCTSPPKRSFTDSDLLIDKKALPENWALAEYSENTQDEEGQVSGAYITFYATDTPLFVRSGEDIFRYSSSERARKHFNRMLPIWSGSAARGTDWLTPKEFDFSSSVANNQHFACQNTNFTFGPDFGKERTVCVYLAQYEEFIVRFTIPIQVDDRQFVTIDEVEKLIASIDRKLESNLQK